MHKRGWDYPEQEVISMEEYLTKRKAIRKEEEKKGENTTDRQISPYEYILYI